MQSGQNWKNMASERDLLQSLEDMQKSSKYNLLTEGKDWRTFQRMVVKYLVQWKKYLYQNVRNGKEILSLVWFSDQGQWILGEIGVEGHGFNIIKWWGSSF